MRQKMKNGTMMQYFEWYLPSDGSLWNQLSEKAPALAEAGITAVWLPPAYKDAYGTNGVGYAVYDLYDLGEFDQKGSVATKYGTKAEYLAAIHTCQEYGIDVYADIVLNHKIGADGTEIINAEECNTGNREQETTGIEQITAWTIFNFPGRKGRYSDFVWTSKCFDGVDWDDKQKKNSIYLFEGKEWDKDVDSENGNYDYLMGADIDFSEPAVIAELTKWGKWYLDQTQVDGFRLDALKHIDYDFYRDWIPAMRSYAGRELFTVGEYWHRECWALEAYLEKTNYALSLFDVPLHFNFHYASYNSEGYDLRKIFDGSLVAAKPQNAVTFVDNHDTEPGQALCSFVDSWFKPLAYALILLREAGYPCVFYGDCYGIPSQNVAPVGKTLTNLLSVRASHAYGAQHDYFDDYHCIGFTREGLAEDENTGLACILSSKNDTQKTMYVGKHHSGQKFFDVLFGYRHMVTIDADGNGSFPVHGRSVSVWIPV